jgi:nucleoside triphosphate diphosphatase
MTETPAKPHLRPEDIPHLDLRSVDTLRRIMAALRSPDGGCPWDLDQDFKSIAPYTIEEAYEVADAINRNDMQNLREELGDLLLQPIYHAQMAAEAGVFTLDDVIADINIKMIRRHPHVFGDAQARSAGVAKGFWEANKAAERKDKPSQRTLDGVPLALPGLTRAVKLQNKAARVGFDWPNVGHVFDKVTEELEELKSAPEPDRQSELGDLLFAVANIARHYGVDPEQALRDANTKFERRFKFIEEALEKDGKNPSSSNLEEMDHLWDKSKAAGL